MEELKDLEPGNVREVARRLALRGRAGVPALMLAARDARTPLEALCVMQALGAMRVPAADEALRRIARLGAAGPRRRVYDRAPGFQGGFGDEWDAAKLATLTEIGDLRRPFSEDELFPPRPNRGALAPLVLVDCLFSSGDRGESRSRLRRLMALSDRVDDCTEAGDIEGSVAAMEQIRAEMPQNPHVLASLAMGYAVVGRLPDADAASAEAVEFSSSASSVLLIRAIVLRRAGRLDEALEAVLLTMDAEDRAQDDWLDDDMDDAARESTLTRRCAQEELALINELRRMPAQPVSRRE